LDYLIVSRETFLEESIATGDESTLEEITSDGPTQVRSTEGGDGVIPDLQIVALLFLFRIFFASAGRVPNTFSFFFPSAVFLSLPQSQALLL